MPWVRILIADVKLNEVEKLQYRFKGQPEPGDDLPGINCCRMHGWPCRAEALLPARPSPGWRAVLVRSSAICFCHAPMPGAKSIVANHPNKASFRQWNI